MAYEDRYQSYLNRIPVLAEEKRRTPEYTTVLGFSSDLDVLLHWDVERYNQLLDQYLKRPPAVCPGETIDTMEDFARISCGHIIQGLGGAYDVSDGAVCEQLRQIFTDEAAPGGACAQAAATIGALGLPVNAHLTDTSREVCQLLNYPGVTGIANGRKVSMEELATDQPPIYHVILQFDKGDVVRFFGREVEIPCSNRLIVHCDPVHKVMPLQEEFFRYWEQTTEKPASFVVSGFDSVVEDSVIEEKLERVSLFLRRLRRKSPETTLYLEGAFYIREAVKDIVFDRLSPYMDIISMNEEELAAQLFRLEKDFGDMNQLDGILQSLDHLLTRFPARGAILHTRNFSLYYGEELAYVDIAFGLTMGNLTAGTRARIGSYGTRQDLRETLQVPLSEAGLEIARQAEAYKGSKQLVVVPSRLMEYPKYTIGLGDAFLAGVQICFMDRQLEKQGMG